MSATAVPARSAHRSWPVSARLPRNPLPFKVLTVALVLLDVGLLTTGWILDRPRDLSVDMVLWAALMAVASFGQLTASGEVILGMDLPIGIAAALVFGPAVAGTIALVGYVDRREWRGLITFTRAVANRAQTSLTYVAAGMVFKLLDGRVGDWPGVAFTGAAALVAAIVVNVGCVAVMRSLYRGARLAQEFGELPFGPANAFVLGFACFGFLGVLLADAYAAHGFWGVLGFTVPILLARQLFLHEELLDTAMRNLGADKQALRRVDERIAEERRDERARIAEALHDDVLQSLYNVTLRTQVIREDLRLGRLLDLDGDVPPLLTASERAVSELRDVIRGLRKSAVGQAGLVDTLILLVNHLRDESSLQFVTELGDVRTSPSTELLLYQVAREALTNAVKHAEAKTVWLRLVTVGEQIELVVEDDGRGFDQAHARDPRHFGLELMRERAEAACGSLSISSEPGSGTVVNARFPPA